MTRVRLRARVAAVAAALLIVVGAGAAAGAVQDTHAAWNDKSFASAVATGGTWSAPTSYGCTAMNADGSVKNGGRCTVTSVTADEWGTAPNRQRGYTVGFNTNAGNGYVQFTISLAVAGASSNFSWSTAGLVGNGQAIPTNGWTCAQLPTLTAKTPTNWGWGSSSQIYFQVVENRSSTAVSCG
ncbi:hypothetical protein [Microbacterium sp. T2.11-28]|uniref:hypothetical protein n=1 Tax=Microbacterium sp. T2.11-28 TaxID=3041169 RepID=UPI0024777800|nr:hypothetical protein [Microbacterium sp. T2.11-28]CAI9392280.1 hypothetical protein MICABA_02062 [Microbacterium sp. T2.11-28]